MPIVSLEVSSELAELIEKKGIAEIVVRQKNARIQALMKALLYHADDGKTNAADLALKTMNQMMGRNFTAQDVNHVIKGIGNMLCSGNRQLSAISDQVRSMSAQVSQVYSGIQSLQSISYLNVGLSAANLAVNVAGMIIIGQKLDSLRDDVSAISRKMADMKEGDIEEQYLNFVHYFETVTRNINDGDQVDATALDKQLGMIQAYLNKLLMYYDRNTLDQEKLLGLMTSLLDMYTSLLNVFLIDFFYEKEKVPDNLDSYLVIYHKMTTSEFQEILLDYMFLDRKMNGKDARDATNATVLLVMNNYVQIIDQMDVLKELKTRENYQKYDAALGQAARQAAEDMIPDLSRVSGINEKECKAMLEA